MCIIFHVNGSISKQSKKLNVEPNRANKNTLRAIFSVLEVYIYYSKYLESCNNMKCKCSRDMPIYDFNV